MNRRSRPTPKKPTTDGNPKDKELSAEELERVTGGAGNAAYYDSQRLPKS